MSFKEYDKCFSVKFRKQTIPIFYYRGYRQVTNCLFKTLKDIENKTVFIDIETCARSQYRHIEKAALRPEMTKVRLIQIYEPFSNAVHILDLVCPEHGYQFKDVLVVTSLFDFLKANQIVAHNAAFEMNNLQHIWATWFDGQINPLKTHCTMNMFRLVVCAKTWDTKAILPGSLKTCMKVVCGVEIDKTQQTSDWSTPELTEAQLDYAASDAYYLPPLYSALTQEIEDYKLDKIHELDSKMLNVTSHMKFHGVTIDVAAHTKLAIEWEERVKEYGQQSLRLLNAHIENLSSKEIYERLMRSVLKKQHPFILEKLPSYQDGVTIDGLADLKKAFQLERQKDCYDKGQLQALKRVCVNIKENFIVNPRSDKQLAEWITKNLPKDVVDAWPRTEGGKDGKNPQLSVSAEAFDNVLYINEELEAINNFKTYSKLESTYGRGLSNHFFVDHNGRTKIYGDFQTCWPDTGRMSCREPNLQNQGRKAEGLRNCFVSRGPDYRLIVADFSMIEVRVAAHLSQDSAMLEAFRNDIDLHSKLGSIILGIDLEDFESRDKDWQKEKRQIAKSAHFAFIFGGGARRVQQYAKVSYGILISDEDALEILTLFRETYPEFRQWQLAVSRAAERSCTTTTLLGKFRTLHPEFTFSNSMNHPVQGTSAELFKMSAIKIQDRFLAEEMDAHIANLIHDEVVVDSWIGDVEEATRIIESSMGESMLELFPDASVDGLVEAHIGRDWGSCKR